MKSHRADTAAAPFRSGTDEEVTDATQLLDELCALEDCRELETEDALEEQRAEASQKQIAGDIVKQAALELAYTRNTVKRAKIKKRKGKYRFRQ